MFDVAAESYDRFMGRYSAELSAPFADLAGVGGEMHVLDVGCGTGVLTRVLADRVGAANVAGVDPTEHFVVAAQARVPGADVRHGPAEALPFADGAFDAALAQLVLNFLRDADAGVAEMRRVVRPGGTLAACTWASGPSMEMFSVIWGAADECFGRGAASGESAMRYRTRDEVDGLFERAGLEGVETSRLRVETTYADFDDFWAPVATASGPVGAFFGRLEDEQRARMREACRRRLGDPAGSFTLGAEAWAVRGEVPAV